MGAGAGRRSLFSRIFPTNAAVLIMAAVLLIASPFTLSAPATVGQALIITAGLLAMLVANGVLVRRAVRPLSELAALMRTIDPLTPGRRLPTSVALRDQEIVALGETFNAMLDRLEQERQASARRALTAQEDERLRMARELHDEIGQSLTATAIDAERAVGAADPPAPALQRIVSSLYRSLDELRGVVRELRPEALDDLGLVNALIALCRRLAAQSGLRIERRFDADLPSRSREVDLVLYRVAQESLTNVIRHAHASCAVLSLTHSAGTLTMSISDDGAGAQASALSANASGLNGMRERAMMIGGRLTIASTPGRGTRVQLDISEAGER